MLHIVRDHDRDRAAGAHLRAESTLLEQSGGLVHRRHICDGHAALLNVRHHPTRPQLHQTSPAKIYHQVINR